MKVNNIIRGILKVIVTGIKFLEKNELIIISGCCHATVNLGKVSLGKYWLGENQISCFLKRIGYNYLLAGGRELS